MDEITQSALNETIRDMALLADITISVWGAERTDHKIMENAKAQANATGNVGRAIKNMLSGADENLKACRAAYAAVRAAHYALTLPFVSDAHAERQRGPRLLPNILFDRYLSEMATKRKLALAALDAFLAGYDADVARAKTNLAALADADYPTPEHVRSLFKVEFDFSPVPEGADFKNLPDNMLQKLSAGLARKQEIALAGAMTAMWAEVRERVTHLSGRLSDPNAKFKASTVDAVNDLIDILPGWNIAQDERVATVVERMVAMMHGVTIKELRINANVRANVQAHAAAILEQLNVWGV